ncbi:MAG: geranylgeranylglyceryl/heptaprenylglyceryl phosphate synthase [Thermoplasmatota archaeon]
MPQVFKKIREMLVSGPLHVTLIDPDRQTPEKALEMVRQAEAGGTSIILVGGTTGVDQHKLDSTLDEIMGRTDLPVILFPASADVISHMVDGVLFMSLMNSRNPMMVIGEAVEGGVKIRDMGVEPISTGYVVVEPGMLVGKVGEVDLIQREDIDTAVKYAVSAEIMGMKLFYIEGGSGVEYPVPYDMIREIRKRVNIPLVVGGGIRSPEIAREAVLAGADIIVTGTMVEQEEDIEKSVSSMVNEMKNAYRER